MRRHVVVGVLAVAVFVGAACGGDGVGPPNGNDTTPATLTITGGTDVDVQGTLQLTVEARNAAGQVVNATVTWTSSDAALATVDNAGTVMGLTRGNVTIRAETAGQSGTISDTHSVTVRIASIQLTPSTTTLSSINDTLMLVAEAQDAMGGMIPGVPIAFASSNSGVVTVASDGTAVAVGNGEAIITASADSRTAQASVSVAQVAMTLTMPASVDTLVSFGEDRAFVVTAADARNNAISDGFAWSSSEPAVATVSGSGTMVSALAVGNGTTTIRVERDGLSADATLVVRQEVTAVVVSPTSLDLLVSFTQQLDGEAQDARGNAVAGAALTWTSSDATVAAVSALGLVSADNPGSATITASTGGIDGTSTVTVLEPSLAQHVQPILSANCALSGCHTGASPARGMNLSSGQTFANTVNVPSGQLPSMDRIEPGQPDLSYLVHKIQGTQASVGGDGSRMPLSGTALSQAQIDTVRAWVQRGAQNN